MEIKRDYYLNKIIKSQKDGLIKVVTGIRRCGKSYLLNTLFYNYLIENGIKEEHIIRVALDDDDNSYLLEPHMLSKYIKEKIIDQELYYIIIDEVQLAPNFEAVLNGLARLTNVDIYVTGSNSKFLSTDIITEFRGRGEQIKIYPLSFSEFMSVYSGDKMDGWNDYITYGGLPLVVLMDDDERKNSYLKDQTKNVYINDVIERNHILNNVEIVNQMVKIISSSIGSLTNPKKISDTFKSELNIDIAPATIATYLTYLEESFMIEKAEKYDIKGRKYISTPSKYYFSDMGLRNSFINYRQQEETHIMENVIFLELKRRGYDVDVGIIENRTQKNGEFLYKQLEVDFIANKGNNKIYIQSAFAMPDTEKRNQEETPLLRINDSFKKIIIVKDYIKKWTDDNGVITMNIFDFLLNEDSLNF